MKKSIAFLLTLSLTCAFSGAAFAEEGTEAVTEAATEAVSEASTEAASEASTEAAEDETEVKSEGVMTYEEYMGLKLYQRLLLKQLPKLPLRRLRTRQR